METQKAAQEYQRSVELYRVAKETLSLAESKLLKTDKREFDAAWQEYVNHATMKVMNTFVIDQGFNLFNRLCKLNMIKPVVNEHMKKNRNSIKNLNNNGLLYISH